MLRRIPVGLLLFIGLVFVGCGDQFLPPSIGRYSFQARNTVDQMLMGAFPSWRPNAKPYERTEDAIQREEKGAK